MSKQAYQNAAFYSSSHFAKQMLEAYQRLLDSPVKDIPY